MEKNKLSTRSRADQKREVGKEREGVLTASKYQGGEEL